MHRSRPDKVYADVDLAAVRAARRFFDPVGHCSRPDIFQLREDTRSRHRSSHTPATSRPDGSRTRSQD